MAKERADKYDKKLKINAPVDEALNILMGKNKPNQMKVIGQGEFEFKPNTLYDKMTINEQIAFVRSTFCIKIPPTDLTKIKVKIEIESDRQEEEVTCWAGFEIKANDTIFYNNVSRIVRFNTHTHSKSIENSQTISLPIPEYSFFPNEILIFANPEIDSLKVKATVITQ